MIGKLIYSQGETMYTASLTHDLIWVSDDDPTQDKLNRLFPGEVVEDLPSTVLGRHMLYQAAERLNGQVTIPRDPIGQVA